MDQVPCTQNSTCKNYNEKHRNFPHSFRFHKAVMCKLFLFFLQRIMGLRQQNFFFIDDETEVGGCDVPSVLQLEVFLGF